MPKIRERILRQKALRDLAGILSRATFANFDMGSEVRDCLMAAGFNTENAEDARILDEIDPPAPE